MAPFPWVELDESREKYTYDIHPFSTFRSDKRRKANLNFGVSYIKIGELRY